MFKELAPCLRQRAVLLTVTHLDLERIRVNLVSQMVKDGEHGAHHAAEGYENRGGTRP